MVRAIRSPEAGHGPGPWLRLDPVSRSVDLRRSRPRDFLSLAILILFAAAGLGCRSGSLPLPRALTAPKLTLNAGEAAQLELGMRPGLYHMIEMSAESVGEGGAEVVLSSGDIEVPPVYFESTTGAAASRFDARLWSPTWPTSPGAPMRVANYGPGAITLSRIRAETGGADALYEEVMQRGPRPVSWTDLKIRQERAEIPFEAALLPPEELEGGRAWLNQQRRRVAFESISGPPIPVRMAEPIRGNVQVRAAALGGAGAVVGLSRPNRVIWKPLGPGWYPSDPFSKWRPIPKEKAMPRGFELRRGSLQRLALYVADPSSQTRAIGSVEARLFRLDQADPVAEAKWYDIGPDGRWLELPLDTPMGPGLYVFEVKATRGAPVWLTWDAEPEPIPGREFPHANETLAIRLADPEPEYIPAIDVQALVVGRASRVESLKGDSATPTGKSPGIGREIVLRAQLAPGETEIFYLQDYRSPVPARAYDAVDAGGETPEAGWWERTSVRLGF